MNIYQLVAEACAKAQIEDTQTVHRLVGTLRSAGFPNEIAGAHIATATQIVLERIAPSRIVTAGTEVGEVEPDEPLSPTAKFDEIESLRGKNLCPRCKREMSDVKLSDYRKAKHCKSCKVALWKD